MTAIEEPRPEPETLVFEAGTLWRLVRDRSRHALEAGALRPIDTEAHTVPEAGIPFSVRRLSTLAEKERIARAAGASGADPFLPPDPELVVAGVSATHVAVLNRFPVRRHHLLVVTREAEDQALPLTAADFDALARCLAEVDGLGFYNSHPEAGASERHRHLQLLPFPVGDGPAPTPIEGALGGVLQDPGRSTLPAYDFLHAACPLPASAWRSSRPAERAAAAMALAYRALGAGMGLALGAGRETAPYNLLVTRRWMLLVPRRRESFEGVSVNALGYAGSLLVKDRAGLETVRRHGPLAVLRSVASSPRSTPANPAASCAPGSTRSRACSPRSSGRGR